MVIVNNPGDWSTVYPPLLHADWHGWTPTDLIFPFFLFIVGVSITLSRSAGRPAAIARRGAIIWGLGLCLAAFPFFHLSTLRIPGVLARIAWCYVAAALLARRLSSSPHRCRTIAATTGGLLIAYWMLLTAVPVPGGSAGDLSPEGNLGAWIDRALLGGHLWRPGWDPEGILSTVPAVGTTLLGVLAGWQMQTERSSKRLIRTWLMWGVAGVTAAYWWCDDRPGPARLTLTEPLVALGRNAILLFVLSGLLAKTLLYLNWPDPSVALGRWIYTAAFAPLAPPALASLCYAIANLLVLYALMAVLHRRRVYLIV